MLQFDYKLIQHLFFSKKNQKQFLIQETIFAFFLKHCGQ